jgi:hypothetical protein
MTFVFHSCLARHPSSVVIDKGDRPAILVDLLLHEMCVEEKKQDW